MSQSSSWQAVAQSTLYCAVATVAVATATGAALLLHHSLQIEAYVSLLLCAILFVAWIGGLGPGLAAVALSILAFHYFLIPPAYSLIQDILRILLFAIAGVFVAWISAAQRRTAESLRRAQNDLKATVLNLEALNKSLKTENDQRTRAEQIARNAERETQATIDAIPAIVARYRRDGSPEYVNQNWRSYTGLSNDRLLGKRWASAAIHPDDLPRLEAAWRAHLLKGQPFDLEHRLCRSDGEYRWFLFRRVPFCDENGNLIRWYGVGHDIEDQKRAESALRTTQAELAHVTRVTTLGEMSASIAHEVNQPLAAISANAEAALRWLGRDVPDIEEARTTIGRIVNEAHRAGEVVRRIRDFSKKAGPQMTQIDINKVVKEAITLVEHEALRYDVAIRYELASGLPPVRGDRIQLQQVIVNFAVNGMEAMATVRDRERMLIVRTRRRETESVLVAVEDAGIGIEPGKINSVFSTFHTTKPNGLGMGLSICKSIIEAHDGELWARPNDGPGVTFQFLIPADASQDHSTVSSGQ